MNLNQFERVVAEYQRAEKQKAKRRTTEIRVHNSVSGDVREFQKLAKKTGRDVRFG